MNVYEKIADRKLIEKSPAVERLMNLKKSFGDDELKCTLRVIKRARTPRPWGVLMGRLEGHKKRVSSSAYLYCEAIRNRPARFTKKHNTIPRLATIPSCINTS